MGVIKNLALNVEKLMLWGDQIELKIASKILGFSDEENEIENSKIVFRNNDNENYNIDDGGNKKR